MYHKVGCPDEARAEKFLNVCPASFLRQMRTMQRLGYRARTFAEVVEAFSRNKSLPSRTFAVTFDDGYACVNDTAAPILRELDIPGTIFVVSQYAGKSNSWDYLNERPVLPLMNWDALRQRQAEGWEIAGHTRTHPHLDQLEDDEALEEIRLGKEEVEAETGQAVTTFCYPFGDLNPRTPRLVERAGFLGACTTKSGIATIAHSPFLLPRVKISYRDRVHGFLYRLLVRPYLF
jgi:peptidoglycan/xylan/chitin deacetylase (PgdA/CDA1 family)